jgi:hypothetical protein
MDMCPGDMWGGGPEAECPGDMLWWGELMCWGVEPAGEDILGDMVFTGRCIPYMFPLSSMPCVLGEGA